MARGMSDLDTNKDQSQIQPEMKTKVDTLSVPIIEMYIILINSTI